MRILGIGGEGMAIMISPGIMKRFKPCEDGFLLCTYLDKEELKMLRRYIDEELKSD